MHGAEKRIVYILRSVADPLRHYVGITNDVQGRLGWHNDGPCGHTINHRPWTLVVSIEFPTERDAVRFEKYLKSGSGRAFAKRHFGILEKESLTEVAPKKEAFDGNRGNDTGAKGAIEIGIAETKDRLETMAAANSSPGNPTLA